MTPRERVYGFKTKYKEGFIQSEVEKLLKYYPDIDMKKFNDALMCNTCMLIDGNIIQYHCDIELALVCGIEKRNIRPSEFD